MDSEVILIYLGIYTYIYNIYQQRKSGHRSEREQEDLHGGAGGIKRKRKYDVIIF